MLVLCGPLQFRLEFRGKNVWLEFWTSCSGLMLKLPAWSTLHWIHPFITLSPPPSCPISTSSDNWLCKSLCSITALLVFSAGVCIYSHLKKIKSNSTGSFSFYWFEFLSQSELPHLAAIWILSSSHHFLISPHSKGKVISILTLANINTHQVSTHLSNGSFFHSMSSHGIRYASKEYGVL